MWMAGGIDLVKNIVQSSVALWQILTLILICFCNVREVYQFVDVLGRLSIFGNFFFKGTYFSDALGFLSNTVLVIIFAENNFDMVQFLWWSVSGADGQ